MRGPTFALRASVGKRASAAMVVLVVTTAFGLWLRIGSLPPGLLDLRDSESVEILDRNGELLYEARADDGSKAAWIDADHLPQPLVDATIAAEDRRFFRHPGIDVIAIARASLRNLRHRRVLEGGSTITQQVAKLLIARQDGQSRQRGVVAKLRESVVALRLEHPVTKREGLAPDPDP